MTNPLNKRSKESSATPFIAGGLIGAVASYFFLTEKGTTYRKKFAERTKALSSGITKRVAALKGNIPETSHNPAQDDSVTNQILSKQEQSDKAHNMVSHLKQSHSN